MFIYNNVVEIRHGLTIISEEAMLLFALVGVNGVASFITTDEQFKKPRLLFSHAGYASYIYLLHNPFFFDLS